MQDSLLQKARIRRDELRRELEELDKFIEVAERLSKNTSPILAAASSNIGDPSKYDARVGSTKEILDKVDEILSFEKHPLKPAELIKRLRSQGLIVKGANPASNLSAMLSVSKRFKTLGHGQGWVPISRQNEVLRRMS